MADAQEPFPDVVSVDWLAERIGSVKVLDGSWYLPTAQRDPVAEFLQSRLPTAQFFELDTIADPNTTLPHMLPSEEAFGRAADALGVQATDTVVVYDRLGAFSAPRVWWTWRVFGHQKVAVLDGGLPAWEGAGHALETAPVSAQEAAAPGLAARRGAGAPSYPARLRRGQVAHWKEVLAAVEAPGARVVDARAAARWRGEAAEPRPGLAAGHMPGSRNVPWDSVLEQGRLRSAEQLRALFEAAGVKPDEGAGEQPWTLSCGTGTTACVLDLAMRRAFPGVNTRVYDGSWSEWGQLPGVPIAKGDAWGVLGTISSATDSAGFPSGSVVEYALPEGRALPVFSLSSLSPHTRDVQRDDRVSLIVPAPGLKGVADARVTLIGRLRRLGEPEESAAALAAYRQAHPDSYWASFGDFAMHEMHDLQSVRIVGGFARAGKVPAADFLAATPCAIAAFTEPIARHLNEDHADHLRRMLRHFAGFPAARATVVGVDALGLDVLAVTEGEGDEGADVVPVRLAYLTPATDRRSVRERLVRMVDMLPPE